MLIASLRVTAKPGACSLLAICALIGVHGLVGCKKPATGRSSTGQGVLKALDKRSAAVDRRAAARSAAKKRAAARKRDPKKPPMDISKPPADVETTASGVSYKILEPSTESRVPTANDTARVHYTAWKTTGEVIYSTHRDEKPQPMPLYEAPPGWREMVTDMRIGERRLCWMPGHLASAVQARATAMTLVFEIELISTHSPPDAPDALDGPPADAKRTESGLAYQVLEPGAGDGKTPDAWDEVAVHYTTWRQNGTLQQDTTYQKSPRRLRAVDDSKGFAEAISLLSKGQRNRVWIPESLRTPLRTGDAGGMHVMEIELFEWKERRGPPPTPKDVASPPATAKQTARGVYYQVLKKGTGTENPQVSSTVKVHYTGWTTDGERFDSSLIKGEPATFGLTDVIAGWTDVVQVMVEGDTIRTWIPEKLAYRGQAGRPTGMLVFEIELLEIVE